MHVHILIIAAYVYIYIYTYGIHIVRLVLPDCSLLNVDNEKFGCVLFVLEAWQTARIASVTVKCKCSRCLYSLNMEFLTCFNYTGTGSLCLDALRTG